MMLFTEKALAAGIINIPRPDTLSDADALATQFCNAATWVFAAAIIFSIVFTLVAAFEYMTSAGDPGKVKQATNRLIFVAVGVAVALIAFLFPQWIATLIKAGSLGNYC